MALFHKVFQDEPIQMYLYYPGEDNRTPFKRRSITVLMDDVREASVRQTMERWGLEKLAQEEGIILSFPAPPAGGWRASFAESRRVFEKCQQGMGKADDLPLPRNSFGIPTTEAMLATWHPMNDTKYVIGTGEGADLALTLGMCAPANIAAVLAEGGKPLPGIGAVNSPVPVCLLRPEAAVADYFLRVNGDEIRREAEGREIRAARHNPWQMTVLPEDACLTEPLMRWVWRNLFVRVRRTNTCPAGDVEPSMDIGSVGFEYHIDEDILGDHLPHTWFTYTPRRAAPAAGWPLVLFFHGGSDNPAEAAEMTKLHELAEREGFIVAYPWGTNRCGWNSAMEPGEADDADFCGRLIDYMLAHAPVDPERVYMTGFSNGAAMAQTVALLYPEKVAALFHIDSNWPGKYGGYQAVTERDITPFRLGFEKKEKYDYRMPVWYTYGSREISFPVYRESTQQNQYDLWKRYNHIPVRPTPARGEENPDGCGVPGDRRETLFPTDRHPAHCYKIERFFTDDPEPLNLYNFVVMHDKGHEIAQMDAELGWRYVRQFRRKADGSLAIAKEDSQR